MPYFTWTKDYTVQHDEMDNQHKKLISYVNDFYNTVDNKNHLEQKIVFNKIVEYTHYHFEEEEKLMQTSDYPDFKKHKMIHDNLVKQVLELGSRLNDCDPKVPNEIKYFLKNWLTAHIKGIDTRYGKYVTKLNPSQKAG